MEKSILLAWVGGLGLLTWQQVQASPWRPPPPGRYLAASGLYAVLGLVAASERAAPAAVMIAWGFDLALALKVLPGIAGAQGSTRTVQQTTQQAPAEGTQTV